MILIDLYSVSLWTYAWMRFGSLSCLLLALASVGALFLALVAAAFPFDLAGMKRFDPTNIVCGFSYFVLQPLAALAATVGQTIWVVSTSREKFTGGSNQSMKPTAPDRMNASKLAAVTARGLSVFVRPVRIAFRILMAAYLQNVLHNYVGHCGGTPSPIPTATPSPRSTSTPRPRPSPPRPQFNRRPACFRR